MDCNVFLVLEIISFVLTSVGIIIAIIVIITFRRYQLQLTVIGPDDDTNESEDGNLQYCEEVLGQVDHLLLALLAFHQDPSRRNTANLVKAWDDLADNEKRELAPFGEFLHNL